MGRFETEWLATGENLAALTDLSGIWIDRVHDRKKPKIIVLDMDSSESPTHGDQEAPPTTGTLAARVTTRSFASTSSATWSVASCAPATSTAPRIGGWFWSRSSSAIEIGTCAATSGGDAAFAKPEIYEFLEAEGYAGVSSTSPWGGARSWSAMPGPRWSRP